MKVKDVPHKILFREVLDLEPGDPPPPIYTRPAIDKSAFTEFQPRAGMIPVLHNGVLTALPPNTLVELIAPEGGADIR